MYCKTSEGIYKVKSITDFYVKAIHSKHWLDEKADKYRNLVTTISKSNVIIMHENLEVVKLGIKDPVDQEAIVKLCLLEDIAREADERKLLCHKNA